MNINEKKWGIYNEDADATYDNWLAFFACIVNPKLTISSAISIMGLNIKTGE